MFDIINTKEFKSRIKTYTMDEFSDLIKILNYELPKFLIDEILRKKFYGLLSLVNLSQKQQMRLVKINPYFIQYIKDPDLEVINYIKQTDENALQFMVGNEL